MIRKIIFGALMIILALLLVATAAGATWGFIALIRLHSVHLFWRICGMLLILIFAPLILSVEGILLDTALTEVTFDD